MKVRDRIFVITDLFMGACWADDEFSEDEQKTVRRLLADLKGDEDFLTGDLEDPVFAVGYGIFYLGQLLDRFEGNAPLAVASYNGGCFNVSSWLKSVGDLPMPELVEHIPFRETRNYTRKVTAAYAHYLDLYEEEGTGLQLAGPPYADHPEVVDF